MLSTVEKISHGAGSGGTYERIGFYSRILREERELYLYRPPHSTGRSSLKPLVLYLHDGQNLFSSRTAYQGRDWNLKPVLDRLTTSQIIPQLFVVGIASDERRRSEYTSIPDRLSPHGPGGGGKIFEEFMAHELVPQVEDRLGLPFSRGERAIGGASLGGLSALSIFTRFPELFSKALILSPSLYWASSVWLKQSFSLKQADKLWIDCGDCEHTYPGGCLAAISHVETLVSLMSVQCPHASVKSYIGIGHQHDERAWGIRCEDALSFLFQQDYSSSRNS